MKFQQDINIPKQHEKVTVEQNLSGSHLNAKVPIDTGTPWALTGTEGKKIINTHSFIMEIISWGAKDLKLP